MYTLRKYIIVYMCDDTLKFVEAYCIAMQITQNGRLKYTFFFIRVSSKAGLHLPV